MTFYDYLCEKRRLDANYRMILRFLLKAKDGKDPHISRHGTLAQAVDYHTKDYMSALTKLQEGLS